MKEGDSSNREFDLVDAKGDYHLTGPAEGITDAGLDGLKIVLPVVPGREGPPISPTASKPTRPAWPGDGPVMQYKHPAGVEPRPWEDRKPDLGAYEYHKK